MDRCSEDRDYMVDCWVGSNKCAYAREAVLAFDSSLQGREEKHQFLVVLDRFREAVERRSSMICGNSGLDEVVGVELFRLYDLAFLVHTAFEILDTTEDWVL